VAGDGQLAYAREAVDVDDGERHCVVLRLLIRCLMMEGGELPVMQTPLGVLWQFLLLV
jgi:hypothetical protein